MGTGSSALADVLVGENGTAVIYDNQDNVLQKLAKNTLATHRSNFIEAVRARNQQLANARIEECYYATTLCHLGNLSYLAGAEKSDTDIADAVKADGVAQEAFGRTLDHLRANNVDLKDGSLVRGARLTFDDKKGQFVGTEKAILDLANQNPLTRREGRGAFRIPAVTKSPAAIS